MNVKERVEIWYEKYCQEHKIPGDLFDIEAETDSSLIFEENVNIIEKKLNKLFSNGELKAKQIKAMEEQQKYEVSKLAHLDLKDLIPHLKIVFITADTGEGKTRFGYHLIEKLKKKMPIYLFKHPKQERIKELGFNVMHDIDELESLNNIALWIDEPQIVFPKYSKRGSIILNRLLSLARQKDILLILSTSDTRYITASEEFYIATFIIKRIEYSMVKRGSRIKQVIRDLATLTPDGYCNTIKADEYVFYNKKFKELNGKYSFKTPSYFDEELSKPFK